MKSRHDTAMTSNTPPDAPGGGDNETGLPWFHTWLGVYVFVEGIFVVWVALLFALGVLFS